MSQHCFSSAWIILLLRSACVTMRHCALLISTEPPWQTGDGLPQNGGICFPKAQKEKSFTQQAAVFSADAFSLKDFLSLAAENNSQNYMKLCLSVGYVCVCFLLNGEDLEPLLDTSVWNRAWRQVEKVIFHHRGLQPHRVSITGCSSINEWVASTFVSLFLVSRVINYLRCMAPLQNAVTAILT